MSIELRIVLLLASLFSILWIVRRIRGSKVKLEDTFYWIGMSVLLAVLGIFPQISYKMTTLLKVQSPANFVFLVMICLLFEKILTLSIEYSHMEDRFSVLNAELALRCKNLENKIKELENDKIDNENSN